MNTVITRNVLDRLLGAARNLINLNTDSTLHRAYIDRDPDAINQTVGSFDALYQAMGAVMEDQKQASPFLRYRREIKEASPYGKALRRLVMAMYGTAEQNNLRSIISELDPLRIRIVLDCLTSFTVHGDRDPFFIETALEIFEDFGEEIAGEISQHATQ